MELPVDPVFDRIEEVAGGFVDYVNKTGNSRGVYNWFDLLVWKGKLSVLKAVFKFPWKCLKWYITWAKNNPWKSLLLSRLAVYVHEKIVSVGGYLSVTGLDKYRVVRRLFGMDTEVVEKVRESSEVSRSYECRRPGSEEMILAGSKAQCMLGEMNGNVFEAFGCAVLFGHAGNQPSDSFWYLVMPEHAWGYTRTIWAKGRQSQVELTYKREMEEDKTVIHLATDLIAVRITQKEMSTIGISARGLLHFLPVYGSEAKIVGCMGKGTLGILKHDTHVFGRVSYSGTTLGGYSGAAYIVNEQIAGIHTYGTPQINGGWSASFIWATLAFEVRRVDPLVVEGETTPTWLERTLQQRKRVRVDKTFYDDECVRIQIDGRYAVVQKSSMQKVCGKDFWSRADDQGYLQMDPVYGYEDREYETKEKSGEVMSLISTPGVSGILEKPEGPMQQYVQDVIHELLKSSSNAKLKEMKRAVNSESLQKPNLSTQGSQLTIQSANSSH